ncbi:LysR family transcriptional regulator [Chelativorans salis]|uniref:LysR family transcriptional regulator n=1 Tax=Chelativorans salis TaxID=2978478 RepID=A0ABT2LY12_9HYPH|nr:LysR family transcriptional regulator [Chelativorans sp. EGI FJ00035]MCT7378273.1 LysR family transcriptional regulator [Chelativorans sp. EGI FJ00035]
MEANPTLDQLQVFLAVAEAGSFSAAARKLNRAQSVISYTIANLEAQLEVNLFDRTGTRRPQLTEAGLTLLEDARRMVAGLQLLRARARGLGQGLEGEVVVAVDVLLPTPVFTTVLKAFRSEYPTVSVRLYTGALGVVWDLVLKHEVHVGIAGAPATSHDEFVSHKVGQSQFIPVAAPGHPLAVADGPVPSSIVREEFQIVITDPTNHTRGKDFGVHAFNTWRVTDAATKHALILAGLGWGGLPKWMVEDDISKGRLVELSLDPYPPTDYSLYAMHAADTPYGPAAAWLVDRFKRELEVFREQSG